MAKLEDSYKTLGLPKGASFEEVHKARRSLAMKWHPDRYQDSTAKKRANRNIQEINAAYAHIKKVKSLRNRTSTSTSSVHRTATATRNRSSNRQKGTSTNATGTRSGSAGKRANYTYRYTSANQSGKQRKKRTHQNKSSQEEQKKKQNGSPGYKVNGEFNRSNLEEILTRKNNERLKKGLARKKSKRVAKMRKRIQQEREEWIRRYEEFRNRSRIGMYRSLINTLLFGKMGIKTTTTTSLGAPLAQDQKHNIEVRHSLIQDHIFYCINKGLNLLLKFTLGIVFGLQLIYNIYQNFFYGYFLGSTGEFIFAQVMVFVQLGLLLIPDNLYQRYLLWKFQNLDISRIRPTFKNRKLPNPFEEQKNKLTVAKYSFLALIIWLFYF